MIGAKLHVARGAEASSIRALANSVARKPNSWSEALSAQCRSSSISKCGCADPTRFQNSLTVSNKRKRAWDASASDSATGTSEPHLSAAGKCPPNSLRRDRAHLLASEHRASAQSCAGYRAQGQTAEYPGSCWHRPHRVATPLLAANSDNACAHRVLPMPGSPAASPLAPARQCPLQRGAQGSKLVGPAYSRQPQAPKRHVSPCSLARPPEPGHHVPDGGPASNAIPSVPPVRADRHFRMRGRSSSDWVRIQPPGRERAWQTTGRASR